MDSENKGKLARSLGLPEIVAISTGAMFSSGFFLLPGIAAQQAGPSVFLAYFLAAFLIVPAMFSMAELATATPKAGGAYFFIDRSLGPVFGTIGGIGNYLALILKTAFALVGIGAYAVIFFEIPIKLTAIIFGTIFMIMNIIGVEKASGLQKVFLYILLVVLGSFIGEGLREIFFSPATGEYISNFTPFLPNGIEGLASTTALVFVSYLGLTHIVSMSEEIKNPERNIPLGMIISLAITTIIYVAGVFIMVGVIPPADLWHDLAPASTASSRVFSIIPPGAGIVMVVIAAVTAFASTGNAGLMTASRYPFAMSRDKLIPGMFSRTGRYNTPVLSVVVTSLIIFVVILFVSERNIARSASSFQLLIFMLINASVIVMRKSKIEAYDPGFNSPLYPWMQIFGIITSFFLIIYLGWGTGLLLMLVSGFSVLWYWYYARDKTTREGAIYHWFALLGRREDKTLEGELLEIIREKGLREGDPFGEMIVQAEITDFGNKRIDFKLVLSELARQVARATGDNEKRIKDKYLSGAGMDQTLIAPQALILAAKKRTIDRPLLYIVISARGVKTPVSKDEINSNERIKVFLFLFSSVDEPKLQLRLLSRLMDTAGRPGFVDEIVKTRNQRELKEIFLQNDRFITLHLMKGTAPEELIGKALKKIRFPDDVLVAIVQRENHFFTPRGNTVLEENDIITVIGEQKGIRTLFNKYIHGRSAGNG
jgi:basic amino acid/polyamine antiporter, APA family